MTSQLLGWDTTPYLDEEVNLQVANFPGLRPAQSCQSTLRNDGQESLPADWEKADIHISITCSTVVTEENGGVEST
jgi:hypothetical protein